MAKDNLIQQVEDWLEHADAPRQQFIDQAKHAHYLFSNILDRWIPGSNDTLDLDGHPASVENMIQSLLLDAVSLMLKNYPMFRIKPQKPADFDLVDEINKHVLAAWKDAECQRYLQLSQLSTLISGMSVLEIYPLWNAFDEMEIQINLVPQTDIWFNPKELNTDRSWVIRRTWHTIEELEADWGASLISRSLDDAPLMTDQALFPAWWSEQGELWPLYTIWVPPNEYKTDIFSRKDRDEAPFGRKVELLNRKIIRDVPNPYAMLNNQNWVGHKTHPYVIHECDRMVDEYGYSGLYDVQGIPNTLESTQWELNELSRCLMQITRRISNPVIIAPEGSLTDPTEHVTYTPGKVLQYDPNISVTVPQPVAGPSDTGTVQYAHAIRMQQMKEQSGIRDMMTGSSPQNIGTSHTPVGTINTVQEASYTRMWTKVNALDRAITQLGRRMLGLMQEFYPVGRYQHLSEAGDSWYGEWQESHIEMEFKIEIVSGMSTPLRDMDRAQTASVTLQSIAPYLQMGAMPQNIPNLQLAQAYLRTLNEPATFEYMNLVNSMLEQAQASSRQFQQQQQQQSTIPTQEGLMPEEPVEAGPEAEPPPMV